MLDWLSAISSVVVHGQCWAVHGALLGCARAILDDGILSYMSRAESCMKGGICYVGGLRIG